MNIYIKYVVVVIIFLIGYFTKDLFWFPLSVQPGCYALLWMCVGNCIWEEKDVLEKAINSISKETVFLGGILIFAVWVEFIINWWPHGGKIFSLASCDIGRGIPDIVSSLCGCYCVFIIAQIIQKYNNISKIFLLCGRYSLLILCIHIVELNLFPWGKILSYLGVDVINNIFIFLIILLKCLFIFFVLALCLKCMFIKKLFEYSSYK